MAGVGNVLRRDDGFGVAVAQRLERERFAPGVRVVDFGIGGIHLVQELYDEYDALVVVDAVDLGREPGTVFTIRPDVAEPRGRDDLADMHYATPERALMLANAVGVLPKTVWLVGCQPRDRDGVGEGLSPEVEAGVDAAVREVLRLLDDLTG